MKKYLVLSAFLCGIVMLFSSCSNTAIQMAVKALNTGCPKQVNEMVTMDSASYQDRLITINYSIDDQVVSIDSLTTISDAIKNQVLLRFQTDEFMKDFVHTCNEADAVIKNIYTGKTSGQSFTIEVTKEDIVAVLNGKIVPVAAPEGNAVREVEESAEGAVHQAEKVIKETISESEKVNEVE